MSELKPLIFSINDLAYIDETRATKNFQNPHDHAVYKATEVDAHIAELEEKHKMEVEQLLIEIAELKEGAKNLILDNYLKDKEIRRHKRKRCLGKAELCHENASWLEDNGVIKYSTFMMRWEKRWLELAEKFKEAK